jgi:hypothetical protein
VLNILPLAGVKDEVDAAIIQLPAGRGADVGAGPAPRRSGIGSAVAASPR